MYSSSTSVAKAQSPDMIVCMRHACVVIAIHKDMLELVVVREKIGGCTVVHPSRTGAAPESPLLAMRPLHAVMREFPPTDIFTAQTLRTADPQISCVCAQCAHLQRDPKTCPSHHMSP